MRIGELAKATGVSRDTIRFYEKSGLLTDITRPNQWNNYKDYGVRNVRRIECIICMKQFGFTLNECKEVVDKIDGDGVSIEEKKNILRSKLDKINQKLVELESIKVSLVALLNT